MVSKRHSMRRSWGLALLIIGAALLALIALIDPIMLPLAFLIAGGVLLFTSRW